MKNPRQRDIRKPTSLATVWLAALCLASLGCQDARQATAKAPSDVQAVDTQAACPVPAPDGHAESNAASAEFTPPFPDREALFSPSGHLAPQDSDRAKNRSGVQLKGFANTDGLRALVLIDGRLTALRAGQVSADVEVLSIEPPRVTFRQADRTWIQSLHPNRPGNRDIAADSTAN